jgi:hypothetical protein
MVELFVVIQRWREQADHVLLGVELVSPTLECAGQGNTGPVD